MPRKEAVRRILAPDGMNLLKRLSERHQVEIVGFHQQAFDLEPGQLLDKLALGKASPEIFATDLNLPLAKIGGDAKLAGIVLFSDGQHNVGAPPVGLADQLGRQGVPIYPVVIGPREPPNDLAILDVQAPNKVFKNAEILVEIRGQITNMPAQEMVVEMQIEGTPVAPEHRRMIQHSGQDGSFSLAFQAKMETLGTHVIQIKATSKEGKEITLANNVVTRVIRVDDEKARVLLIDGEARWEYHYLANALLQARPGRWRWSESFSPSRASGPSRPINSSRPDCRSRSCQKRWPTAKKAIRCWIMIVFCWVMLTRSSCRGRIANGWSATSPSAAGH